MATANNECGNASAYLQGAVAVLSVSSLTFGTQVIGPRGPSQLVTLTNSLPYSIHRISTTGDFRQTHDCGSTLAGGAHCNTNVVFKPSVKGFSSGSLTITDDVASSPQIVSLTGTGTVVELSVQSLDFGTQTVHTFSAPQTVRLRNRGTTLLDISSIGITGGDSHDFVETTTCPSTLPANGRCFINVRFRPTKMQASGRIRGN